MLHVAASFKDKERRVRVAAWRSFFKWAIKQRLVDRNPCDSLPEMKAQPQGFIDTFSDAEIAALTGLPIRDGALMQLLIDEGLRKADARHFKLFNLRGSDLVILKGKGRKDRIIPATRVVQKVNELALLDGINEQDHLWYSRPGGGSKISRAKPIVDSSFHRWWVRCLDQAGVPYRHPHVARHTFATRWLRAVSSTVSSAVGASTCSRWRWATPRSRPRTTSIAPRHDRPGGRVRQAVSGERMNALAVKCPWCGRKPGLPCISPLGKVLPPHAGRVVKAESRTD